jgi:MerR family transcriptional regulator, thiopeptide resistance regulator
VGRSRTMSVGDIATLTGVTVRALHHYDRIGLLRPSGRGENGYRRYADEDLLRLQQILTLRVLGFPLKQIGGLLDRPDFDLVASLRIQQRALAARAAELERARAAIGDLLASRLETGEWDWNLVTNATEAAASAGHEGDRNVETLYTPDEMRRFAELRASTPEEEVAAVQDGWTDLLAEMRANPDLDPASPEAQAVADRWDELTARVTASFRRDPTLLDKIRANYESGAFAGNPRTPQPAEFAFIERVKAARATGEARS